LGGSSLEFTDKAVSVCPVGAIMPKHLGYETPVGQRLYDNKPISVVGDVASHTAAEKPFINGDSHD
jgi:[NiFe] hydrogenase diaphorase moiety small subunit